jgi:hypothetical protein
MTSAATPKLLKAGLVVLAPGGTTLRRTIALQYNPDSLSRSYQVQGVGGERAQAFRFKGAAIESIRLEAEIDSTDQLEFPDRNPTAIESGLAPQLAVLEALVNPTTAELLSIDADARGGTLEILPPEAPLVIFVWGRNRIVPVRVTEFSVTEEAFDPSLNPIRARVSLGLHVLSVDDLGYSHRGGNLFLSYLRSREALASRAPGTTLQTLGISNLP